MKILHIITSLGSGGAESILSSIVVDDKTNEHTVIVLKDIWECESIIKDSNIGHYANADTPDEIKEAIGLGAQGIGLCRTEHLIIEDNLINLQTFFLTDSEETKHDALIEFLTSHYNKFKQTYKLVGDMPLYVRLLDPPLSEFLPSPTEMSHIESLASAMGDDPNKIKNKIAQLKSDDSMLGLRGCRLGIVYPELYDAQIRAIFSAAKDVSEETGKLIKPTIILPFVINPDEVIHYKKRLDRISSQLGGIKYELGVMIETPSALYEIPRIAEHASNLSIGTNDLTMLFFGISRNDNSLSKIAESYSGEGIDLSMFSTLNKGLISLLSSQLQNIPPEIKVGFCGTHAADYKTIHQLYGSGMKFDYLSVEAPLLQRTVLLSESQRVNLHK